MVKKILIFTFLLCSTLLYSDNDKRPSSYFLDYEKETLTKKENTPINFPEVKEEPQQEPEHLITTKPIASLMNTKLLDKAKEYLGTPYGFGSKDKNRTDCSGFTRQVFAQFGISLPHSATEQAQLGTRISKDELQVGDLVFYRTYKHDPSHVGIYAGNGKIIHASYRGRKVMYDDMDKGYYQERYLYAKRITLKEDKNI